MNNKILLFNLSILFCFFYETSYSQTPITDTNFNEAIDTCLSTNPVDGMCTSSQYGAMPNWDISNVTNMFGDFMDRNDFNVNIGNWDVSNLTEMGWMFYGATSFHQNIGNWDVSSVTNMALMFEFADAFNQDIGYWDVSNVTSMWVMFASAHAFNQDLSNWDVVDVTFCEGFFPQTLQWTLPKPNFTNCTP